MRKIAFNWLRTVKSEVCRAAAIAAKSWPRAIASATSAAQVQELVGAVGLALSSEELAALDAAGA